MKWWISALGLMACGGLPEVTDEGVHIRVARDPALVMCGGTLDHMDAFVALLSAEFGTVPPTGDARYTYYWLEPEGFDERTPCPHELPGCSFDDAVWMTGVPANHELVHAVAWQSGTPRPYFIEGLAVAYEGQVRGSPEDVKWGAAQATIMASHSRWVDYLTAGGFVRSVIDAHGAAAFMRFYAKVPFLGSRGRVEREFKNAFGESLDAAAARFDRDQPCEDTKSTALLVECAAPEIAWDGRRFAEYRTVACEQDDVVGPYGGDTAVVFRTIDVPESGEYEVSLFAESLTGEGDAFALYVTPCRSCVERETEVVSTGSGTERVELAAGLHSLRLVGPARGEASVGLKLERRP